VQHFLAGTAQPGATVAGEYRATIPGWAAQLGATKAAGLYLYGNIVQHALPGAAQPGATLAAGH
jgi:hypothetical protein